MIKIYTTLILGLFLISLLSCTKAGTLEHINRQDINSNIEVYRYFFEDGEFVYVSRFKNEPKVQTTTWSEIEGKHSHIRANIVIYENDSIIVMKKNPPVVDNY
jgi:hypothetical protein